MERAADMNMQQRATRAYERWLAKIDLPAYGKGEDLFNAVSHFLGAAFGVVALALTIGACVAHPSAQGFAAAIIYCLSVIILYGASGAYHFAKPGNVKRVLRVVDHCTIYLLIAGSYTPVLLLALGEYSFTPYLFAFEWGIALLGIVINMIDMAAFRTKVISMISYIAMGWAIAVTPLDTLFEVGAAWMPWILAGGIVYMVGIIFYGVGSKVRYMHSVWHLFVLAGTILQFIGFFMLF